MATVMVEVKQEVLGFPAPDAPPSMLLQELPTGVCARVASVADGSAVDGGEARSLGLARRLAELGFLPGERLKIVARGFLGGEPIAVRIGTGTFALRLFEADCIRIHVEPPLPG